MAGERLAIPGYREVSAVCTHPAHLGHGYAQQLTREATATILADGDIPFLHVAGGNGAAIHIYEQLGFGAARTRSSCSWSGSGSVEAEKRKGPMIEITGPFVL